MKLGIAAMKQLLCAAHQQRQGQASTGPRVAPEGSLEFLQAEKEALLADGW